MVYQMFSFSDRFYRILSEAVEVERRDVTHYRIIR
jgi:hypothetical protein